MSIVARVRTIVVGVLFGVALGAQPGCEKEPTCDQCARGSEYCSILDGSTDVYCEPLPQTCSATDCVCIEADACGYEAGGQSCSVEDGIAVLECLDG